MHEVLDRISLELARRVAERLRRDPSLVQVGRDNLERWRKQNGDSPALLRNYREWQEILNRPLEEVLTIMCAETDEGQRLRQNAPFTGILDQQEVLAVKTEFRRQAKAAANQPRSSDAGADR
jgi:hypothetical protein